jgi:hypothetical protein
MRASMSPERRRGKESESRAAAAGLIDLNAFVPQCRRQILSYALQYAHVS